MQILYAVGILACVYHLANGVWTMGITWGVWVSPAAQRKATAVCTLFGVGLAFVGLSALWGMSRVNIEDARKAEDQMFEAKLASGELQDSPATHHKRGDLLHAAEGEKEEATEEEPAEIETGKTSTFATTPWENNRTAPAEASTSRQASP